MKTLMLLIVFALLPLVYVNAQDIKVTENSVQKGYTIAWKDVSCPDCQGWGWLVAEGFKNSTNGVISGTGSSQASISRGTRVGGLDRHRCMLCNGTGKIQVKYYKPVL